MESKGCFLLLRSLDRYHLKNEPSTVVVGKHETDDQVLKYFRGQFISAAEAAADLLGDPVFKFDRQSPII